MGWFDNGQSPGVAEGIHHSHPCRVSAYSGQRKWIGGELRRLQRDLAVTFTIAASDQFEAFLPFRRAGIFDQREVQFLSKATITAKGCGGRDADELDGGIGSSSVRRLGLAVRSGQLPTARINSEIWHCFAIRHV